MTSEAPTMKPVLSLLRETWNLYKKQLNVFLGYSAWILVPYVLIILISVLPIPEPLQIALSVILVLLQAALVIWAVTAIVIVTDKLARKKKLQLKTISQKAWVLVPHVFLVAVIAGLITMGGLILLVIPGLIFFVWYYFAQIEVVLNKKRGMESLTSSHNLVRGKFWPVTWRIVAGQLFLMLAYFFLIAILVSIIAMAIGAPETIFTDTETAPLWAEVTVNIVEMLSLPLFVIYITLLYNEVRSTQKDAS